MQVTASTIVRPLPTHLTSKCRLFQVSTSTTQPFQFNSCKNVSFILTRCSTKSNTNKENSMEEKNSSPEPTSNSKSQVPSTPNLNQSLSSSSSFSKGLIFDLGQDNSWDNLEIGSPVIRRFLSDEEERWFMWYHGKSSENPNSDSIGLAVSSNGIHWERSGGAVNSNVDVGLVMSCSKDWWAFDTLSVRPSEMVIMSSNKVRAGSAVYWLYYTGFSSEKIESLDSDLELGSDINNVGSEMSYKSLPGLAMSQDGRYWARIEGEHHSGALLDVGSEGEWDSLFISSPQVVFHKSGDLRMYYHSFDAQSGHFAVGIARSRDGIRWVKLGKIMGGGTSGAFDEYGIVNARVVKNKKAGKYVMVYEGLSASRKRNVGIAVSSDGLKDWKRIRDSPVFEQSEDGGWDCEGVGMPCLVHMDGEVDEWRLYYRGIGKEGRTGIGLATSKGSDLSSFSRSTGFHL